MLINLSTIQIKGPFWTAEADLFQLSDPEQHHALQSLFLSQTPQTTFGVEEVLRPKEMLALCAVQSVTVTVSTTVTYTWTRTQPAPSLDDLSLEAIQEAVRETGEVSLLLLHANDEQWPGEEGPLPEFTCVAGEISLDVLEAEAEVIDDLYKMLSLSRLSEKQEDDSLENRASAARPIGEITAHSSGLSLLGKIHLPWSGERSAIFQLARLRPNQNPDPAFRLSMELERLTEGESKALRADWQKLDEFLSPNLQVETPSPLAESTPVWITLEIADPAALPRFYWHIEQWSSSLQLFFEPDSVNLILSDQHPDDEDNASASLSRIVASEISLVQDNETQLQLTVKAGDESAKKDNNKLAFSAKREAKEDSEPDFWNVDLEATNLIVAFDPVQTPRLLRNIREMPEPIWLPDETPTPIEPPVVWGFMPLHNGWAQLPIPNLSEQVYLDSGVAQIKAFEEAARDSEFLLGGAVSFGNDRPEILAEYPEEQPWSLTAIDARYLQGTWTLKKVADQYTLEAVSVDIYEADVILNGIFWLNTGKPTAEDAIPELVDWTAGLQSVPLRTVKPTQLFPPPLALEFTQFQCSLLRTDLSKTSKATNVEKGEDTPSQTPQDSSQTSQVVSSAQLDGYSFLYQADKKNMGDLIDESILSANTLGRHSPIIWLRHPTLPMIQALPLTQSKTPPNHPSQSRQLVPFTLATKMADYSIKNDDGTERSIVFPVPDTWRFDAAVQGEGAKEWPTVIRPEDASSLAPLSEWQTLHDLPLVSLSLPGLVLFPAGHQDSGLSPEQALGLAVQYRFDLPYTDEVNALAQLPKVDQNPTLSSPLAEAPPPDVAKPLTRETFSEHWKQLSEEASLAALDAVDAFLQRDGQTAQDGQITIEHIAEPLSWYVKAEVDLSSYPGRLVLENDEPVISSNGLKLKDATEMILERKGALRGFHGTFEIVQKSANNPASSTENSQLAITAGSMPSVLENGSLRDQRGLLRTASAKQDDFIKTPLKFNKDRDTSIEYVLRSLLSPYQLEIPEIPNSSPDTAWHFWFRDLPMQKDEFLREMVISEYIQDINDPEALSRNYNFLNGYEWRLGQPGQAGSDNALQLYGLIFYPLTLERVKVGENTVEAIEMVGRLQLPLKNKKQKADDDASEDTPPASDQKTIRDGKELTDFNNAVRLTFEPSTEPGLALKLTGIAVEPGFAGEEVWVAWPLALDAKGEPTDAPLLRWKDIALNENGLSISKAQLKFFHFDVEWTVTLEKQSISFPNPTALSIPMYETDQTSAVYPDHLYLNFWPSTTKSYFDPQVSLTMNINLGDNIEMPPVPSPKPPKRRVTEGLQVLYTFAEGGGLQVFDVSNVGEPLDLQFRALGNYQWTETGLNILSPAMLISTGQAEDVTKAIKDTLANDTGFTIELWITPANDEQSGPATIFSLTDTSNTVEISLGQGLWGTQPTDLYSLRVRDSAAGSLMWVDTFNHFYSEPTHLVYVQTKETATLYLRPMSSDITSDLPTFSHSFSLSLDSWQANEFKLVLANSITGNTPWLGTIHSVAVYDHILDEDDIDQNFDSGVDIPPPPERTAFTAQVCYHLLGDRSKDVEWLSGYLFSDMQIRDMTSSSVLGDAGQLKSSQRTLEFQWQQYNPARTNLQLLPGMHLDPNLTTEQLAEAPGYAVMIFEAVPMAEGIPTLILKTALVEALLTAQWGRFLQEAATGDVKKDEKELIFSSSAGQLTFGYTSHWNFQLTRWEKNFLLNGFLEIKNLVSWPKDTTIEDTMVRFPAAQNGSADHWRHTIRILLNQHSIPSEKVKIARGELLFNLKSGISWQFLSVVEHQLVEISRKSDSTTCTLGRDRRWTTLQEVRLLTPNSFETFLNDVGELQAIAPNGSFKPVEQIYEGYLTANLREELVGSSLFEAIKINTLIVEASAPHWIKRTTVQNVTQTTLQFLPRGNQTAILSQPEDYTFADTDTPEWLLLTMPFLGRLQASSHDGLITPLFLNELQVDPVLRLEQNNGPLPGISLSLASLGDGAPINVNLSKADVIYRTGWLRLDPLALAENWARLQNPLPEATPAQLQSITSALPDTPARLSRSTALRHAFDAFRLFFPPHVPVEYQLPPAILDNQPTWREDGLLVMTSTGQKAPFGSAFIGLNKIVKDWPEEDEPTKDDEENKPKKAYHVASTITPGNLNPAHFPLRIPLLEDDLSGENEDPDVATLQSVFSRHGLPLTDEARISPKRSDDTLLVEDDVIDQTYVVKIKERTLLIKPVGFPLNMAVSPYLGMGLRTLSDDKTLLFEITLDTPEFDDLKETLKDDILDRVSAINNVVKTVFENNGAKLPEDSSLLVEITNKKWRITSQDDRASNTYLIVLEDDTYKAYHLNLIPRLVSVELLCLDKAVNTLRPIASHTWEYPNDNLLTQISTDEDESALLSQESILKSINTWASETKMRLTPNSPIAIVRLRQINQNLNSAEAALSSEALLSTTYSFALVDEAYQINPLAKRVFQLRTSIKELRFREGQFSGNQMPANLKPFELAPPQLSTVQPFYENKNDEKRQEEVETQEEDESKKEKEGETQTWPWGMSSLRLETKYSKQGIVGLHPEADDTMPMTLWWQAPSHLLQYRSALHTTLPTAGLPPIFRARGISSFLPTLSRPKLPQNINGNWQPVLPDNLSYLIVGSRPGAMLALRHQLIRQLINRGDSFTENSPVVSGSLPVQHRVPRPVPLPCNTDKATALQTWASYFESGQNLLINDSPVDEAFFGPCGEGQNRLGVRRVKMKLATPHQGLITPEWDGQLRFDIWFDSDSDIEDQKSEKIKDISIEVLFAETVIPYTYTEPEKSELASVIGSEGEQYQFDPASDDNPDLRNQLLINKAGDTLTVKVTIKDEADNGFKQILTFPLRIMDDNLLRLPLEPRFIYFEDPEYNRLLATPSANATKMIELQKKIKDKQEILLIPLKLSADRREYNPDSTIALRYDWDGASEISGTASITIKRIDTSGIPTDLVLEEKDVSLEGIDAGRLKQFSLSNLKKKVSDDPNTGAAIQFKSGDVLELTLANISIDAEKNPKLSVLKPKAPDDKVSVILKLNIVFEPVTPTPQAGYGLLRIDDSKQQVECRRFAWSPNPTRIDLVCPDDIKAELVRRRSVFKWIDTGRSNTCYEYAIQKISHSGSTHFPWSESKAS